MRDSDVRDFLHKKTLKKYHIDPDSWVLDEFGICQGEARVDIAVINGELLGFEIKSAKDTLERLPRQEALYSQVFDRMTIVVDEKKIEDTLRLIPNWWGVMVASGKSNQLNTIKLLRRAKKNKTINARSLVELLWKDEVIGILKEYNAHKGLSSKPRSAAWDKMTTLFSLDELREMVRATIKIRENWRTRHQE